jgi:hypothetical protein
MAEIVPHGYISVREAQIFATTDAIAERDRKIGGETVHSIGEIARLQRVLDNNAKIARGWRRELSRYARAMPTGAGGRPQQWPIPARGAVRRAPRITTTASARRGRTSRKPAVRTAGDHGNVPASDSAKRACRLARQRHWRGSQGIAWRSNAAASGPSRLVDAAAPAAAIPAAAKRRHGERERRPRRISRPAIRRRDASIIITLVQFAFGLMLSSNRLRSNSRVS